MLFRYKYLDTMVVCGDTDNGEDNGDMGDFMRRYDGCLWGHRQRERRV